jgi:hypothetical protein
MWGLNLGTGTKEEAVAEATDVTAALGDRLQSFQIGNEVDFLPRFKGKFDAYHSAYLAYKSAIRSALPNSVFSGPDCANNLDWVPQFAQAEHKDMQLLTHHYYVGDQSQKSTSIEKMLKHDDRWEKRLASLQQICQTDGIAYRINEVNSFSGGGREGVSDTFAEALWCLDFMFEVASHGCNGVNIQTDINHLAWVSHYSPIIHDATGIRVRPEYYGMLAFAVAGNGKMLKTTVSETDANISAYATVDQHGTIWVTLINKNLDRDLKIELSPGEMPVSGDVYRLTAPTAQSAEKVTYGETEVAADGTWTPKPSEKIDSADRVAFFNLRHASAAVISLRRLDAPSTRPSRQRHP